MLVTAVAMVSSNHDQPLGSFREEKETSIQDFLNRVQLLEPPASPIVREKVLESPVTSYPGHEDEWSGYEACTCLHNLIPRPQGRVVWVRGLYEASVDSASSCPHIAVPLFTGVVWNLEQTFRTWTMD